MGLFEGEFCGMIEYLIVVNNSSIFFGLIWFLVSGRIYRVDVLRVSKILQEKNAKILGCFWRNVEVRQKKFSEFGLFEQFLFLKFEKYRFLIIETLVIYTNCKNLCK